MRSTDFVPMHKLSSDARSLVIAVDCFGLTSPLAFELKGENRERHQFDADVTDLEKLVEISLPVQQLSSNNYSLKIKGQAGETKVFRFELKR